jgi:uncharacterized membrane protein
MILPRAALAAVQVKSTEQRVGMLFRVSLLFKAVFSVLEIVAGVLGYVLSQHEIVKFVTWLTQEELSRDPDDRFAQALMHAADNLSLGTQRFAALYLLGHGIVKTFLIVGLLRERLAYYPLSILAFTLFVVYQLYRYQTTHSIWLLILTAIDIAIIALTIQEYRYLRRRLQGTVQAPAL